MHSYSRGFSIDKGSLETELFRLTDEQKSQRRVRERMIRKGH